MATARRREAWQHTSHLLAELMNGPRTRRDKRAWLPSQLDPFAAHATAAVKVTRKQFVRSLITSWL